jgi:hypothetical protein
MPRVFTKTKATYGRPYSCCAPVCVVAQEDGGSRDIKPGTTYYQWTRRFGRTGQTYRQHTACGRPKPTQLSSRKTAQVEEAIDLALGELSAWSCDLPALEDIEAGNAELAVEGLEEIAEGVCQAARDVADEYEEGVYNMPDSLQSSPTGEAMTQVAEELREWADNIESEASDVDSDIDWPEREDDQDDGDFIDSCQEALDNKLDEMRSGLESLFEDVPEFQG